MTKTKFKADSPRTVPARIRLIIGWLICYTISMTTLMPVVAALMIYLLKGGLFAFSSEMVPFLLLGPHQWFLAVLEIGQLPPIVFSSLTITLIFTCLIVYSERGPNKRLSKKALFGPAAEKTHEHGSAEVTTSDREHKRNTRLWNPDLPFPFEAGGVVYGWSAQNKSLYLSNGESHTCIIGIPGSGKDRRILLPSIFTMATAGDAMIIIDPKGELYSMCHRFLERLGYTVPLIDLRNTKRSWLWNPFTDIINTYQQHKAVARAYISAALDDITKKVDNIRLAQQSINRANEEAESLAKDIAEIFVPMEIGASNASFWNNSSRVMIYALALLVCTYERKEIEVIWRRKLKHVAGDVARYHEIEQIIRTLPKDIDVRQRSLASVEWLIARKGAAHRVVEKNVRKTVMGLNDVFEHLPDDHIAKVAFSQALNADAEPLSSIVSTVQTTLDNVLSRSFKATSYESSFVMEDFMKKKMAAFVVVPDEEPARAPVALLFIQQAYRAMVKLSNANGGTLPRRLQMIISEFGNIPLPIRDFGSMLAVSRQRDMIFTADIQNYEQVIEKYGVYGAANILNNFNTTIFLATNSEETAKKISIRLGMYTYREQSTSTNHKIDTFFSDSKGETSRLNQRYWLTTDEVLKWSSRLGAIVFRAYPDDTTHQLHSRDLTNKLINPAIFQAPDISKLPLNEFMGLGTKEHNQRLWREDELIDRSAERMTVIPWDAEPPSDPLSDQAVFKPGTETEEVLRLKWAIESEREEAETQYRADEDYFSDDIVVEKETQCMNSIHSQQNQHANPHKERADIVKAQVEVMKVFLRKEVLPHKPRMEVYENTIKEEKKRIKMEVGKDPNWCWTPTDKIKKGGAYFGYQEEMVFKEQR